MLSLIINYINIKRENNVIVSKIMLLSSIVMLVTFFISGITIFSQEFIFYLFCLEIPTFILLAENKKVEWYVNLSKFIVLISYSLYYFLAKVFLDNNAKEISVFYEFEYTRIFSTGQEEQVIVLILMGIRCIFILILLITLYFDYKNSKEVTL